MSNRRFPQFPRCPSRVTACFAATAIVLVAWLNSGSLAQGPLDGLIGGNSRNLSRLPDDQIEGTIWEYKGTLKDDRRRDEEVDSDEKEEEAIEGRFRFEDSGVFDVGRSLTLPSRDKVLGVIESLRDGDEQEIKLPGGGKTKRIGNYRLSKGRLRLDLDDEESLFGVMVLRRKKKTNDVWQGTFQQKEGKRTVRTWQMEVRPVED